MKRHILYGLWLLFYIICLVLGFSVPAQTEGAQRVALFLLAMAFFVPGFLLLWEGHKQQDKKLLRRVQIASILSLSTTMLVLLLNVLSVLWPEKVGNLLYQLLIFVSVPMIPCGSPVLSLFLWACLLFGSFQRLFRFESSQPTKKI